MDNSTNTVSTAQAKSSPTSGLFLNIPLEIAALPLAHSSKLVYGALKMHARQKGVCRVRWATLQRETTLSRASVGRALRQLKDATLVGALRTGRSSYYVLYSPPAPELLEDCLPTPPAPELLEDCLPTPPAPELLEDCLPTPPAPELLEDCLPTPPAPELLEDCLPTPPAPELLEDCLPTPPAPELLEDCLPTPPAPELLEDCPPASPAHHPRTTDAATRTALPGQSSTSTPLQNVENLPKSHIAHFHQREQLEASTTNRDNSKLVGSTNETDPPNLADPLPLELPFNKSTNPDREKWGHFLGFLAAEIQAGGIGWRLHRGNRHRAAQYVEKVGFDRAWKDALRCFKDGEDGGAALWDWILSRAGFPCQGQTYLNHDLREALA